MQPVTNTLKTKCLLFDLITPYSITTIYFKHMNNELSSLLYGTDINKEISLFEYGVLVAPYPNDGNEDEYFVLYSIGNDRFDTGYIRECELDKLLNGEEWADQKDIKEFLSFFDTNLESWLQSGFVNKIQDCIGYWGYDEIMGSTYHEGITKEQVREMYL